jgi:hypothetical protein
VTDEYDLDDYDREQEERERRSDDQARRCRGNSAEQVLVAIIRRLTEKPGEWWATGLTGERYKGTEAQVYRTSRPQTLLIAGENDLADGLRELLASGAAAGWDLFRLPEVRTPLYDLEAILRPISGVRYVHILRRADFHFVEEVAALTDSCLRDFRGGGAKFVATVRMALAVLDPDAHRVHVLPGDRKTIGEQAPAVPDWLADQAFMAAFAKVARWAASERDAERLGDVLHLTADPKELPEEVAAAWDRVSRRPLSLLGADARDVDLDRLVETLLSQVSDSQRTILTARTFASSPCSVESLAAGLGMDTRQVENAGTIALERVTRNIADEEFAPLRWRAESGDATSDVSELTAKILDWLAAFAARAASVVTDPLM